MKFSSRLDGLETSDIRKLFEKAPPDAINMGIGEPDFQPPEHVRDAVKKAIDSGQNKYGPIAGLPALREAIAARYRKYKADVTKENVVVTAGGSEALLVCALGLYDKGDEVLVPDPGFVFYAPHARMSGAKPLTYSLKQENDFGIDEEELKTLVTKRTKAIVVNTPSNPCGGALNEKEVGCISDLAKDSGLFVISDEVYDEIVYERPHVSFMGRCENLVLINSFSKTYAMTGWRIGYMAGDQRIMENLSKIHYYTIACPSSPYQHGAIAALTGPQDAVGRMVTEFRERRDFLVKALNETPGFKCTNPRGAFYTFPSFDFKLDDRELAMQLLNSKVICTPGISFGSNGARHMRFSYANSLPNLKKGIELIRSATKGLVRA
jgi:aspartate aminotransferase